MLRKIPQDDYETPDTATADALQLHLARVLAAVDELLETLRVEADHEVLSMRDRGDPGSPGQVSPFPEGGDVLGDVQLLKITSALFEPSLGLVAVVSSGSGVDTDLTHRGTSFVGERTKLLLLGELPRLGKVDSSSYCLLYSTYILWTCLLIEICIKHVAVKFSRPPGQLNAEASGRCVTESSTAVVDTAA